MDAETCKGKMVEKGIKYQILLWVIGKRFGTISPQDGARFIILGYAHK